MSAYLLAAPAPTPEQLAEIVELEEAARQRLAAREESFQRCDTDGFLSQWALGITAQLHQAQVVLLRQGGYSPFPVLCDADDNVIATRIYRFANQYNYGTDTRWRLPDGLADKLGRKWVPTGSKSRVQAQLGLHEERRWFPARAVIASSGKGLSGCATAYVDIVQEGA